jgi:hypothetical protein
LYKNLTLLSIIAGNGRNNEINIVAQIDEKEKEKKLYIDVFCHVDTIIVQMINCN